MLEYECSIDPEDIDHKICYLFFEENNQIYLLLGRKENDDKTDDDESHTFTSSSISKATGMNMPDSDIESQEDEDDDSPYFVKILLDAKFLVHLEEPRITEGNEIKDNNGYETLMDNSVFTEIIRRELEMMFGRNEKTKSPVRL